jgi:hypothetical protein
MGTISLRAIMLYSLLLGIFEMIIYSTPYFQASYPIPFKNLWVFPVGRILTIPTITWLLTTLYSIFSKVPSTTTSAKSTAIPILCILFGIGMGNAFLPPIAEHLTI